MRPILTSHSTSEVTKNQTSVQCNEPPYTNKTFVPVIITFFVLALIAVLLRAAARIVSQAKFWYDDYFNFAAFVAGTVYTLMDVHRTSFITYLHQNILTGSVLYTTSRTLIRISIILFYLRIFDTTCARNVIKWTLVFVTCFYPTALFPIIFQCSPVDYLWLRWDGTRNGRCIDFRVFVWAITIIGIALDFWIVLVSCRLMIGLQLPLKKKLMVSGMFTAGLLTIAVSIARLPCTNQFTVTENPTSTTKKIDFFGCFTSQEAQVAEHVLGVSGMPYDSLEMAPTNGKVNDVNREDGSIVTGNAHPIYLHFIDSEPGSL
ncbi:hypothetical protein GGR55DRAFT_700513 [Xylaria sp. FL0064]|nr:hypothetical protein GGR55DRAFT_700513 [Xylaria sp. FL0064]